MHVHTVHVLQGFQLIKTPSVTLSESDVLDMFSFLEGGGDETNRLSSAPQMSQISESLEEGGWGWNSGGWGYNNEWARLD